MKKIVIATIIALSGALAGCSMSNTPNGPIDNGISVDEAKRIALEHANITPEQISIIQAEHDIDNGLGKYDVEFYVDTKEYDYEINANTGEIISYDYDVERDLERPIDSQANQPSPNAITEEKARTIALEHANLAADQISFIQVDYDVEDGMDKYEVEFYSDNIEYNYEINAIDGQIIGYEKEVKK